jgi:hypothetical protein
MSLSWEHYSLVVLLFGFDEELFEFHCCSPVLDIIRTTLYAYGFQTGDINIRANPPFDFC